MFNSTDLEDQTLKYVNDLRKQYGHKELIQLPKAVKGNSRNCVIARALHDINPYVSVSHGTTIGEDWHAHPLYISKFIGEFDHGQMPHLVRGSFKHPDKLKFAEPKKVKPSLWSIIKDQFRTPQTEGINERMKGIAAAHERPEPTHKSDEPSHEEKFLQQMALEQQEMDKKIELAEIELQKEKLQASVQREKERTRQKELELELERERTIRATAAEDTKPLLVSDIVNA